MSTRRFVSMIGLAVVASLVISSPALAKKKKKAESFVTYAVSFSCGTSEGTAGTVAGEYATGVTVTNLSESETMARARIQVTWPVPARSDRIRRTLPAGRSFLIDCDTLANAFLLPEPRAEGEFFQGVLTLDSRAPLNVVVQTSAAGRDGGISVDNRQVPGTVVKHPRERNEDNDDEEICHIPPGNPDARHTIEVGQSAVSAHLGHGDHMGECDDDDDDDD